MANSFTDALTELIGVQADETGEPSVCDIGRQRDIPCLILTDPFNSVVVAGSESETGRQRIMVKKSLLTSFASQPQGQPPINVTKTKVKGINAFVLAVNEANGVLIIDTGFPDGDDE